MLKWIRRVFRRGPATPVVAVASRTPEELPEDWDRLSASLRVTRNLSRRYSERLLAARAAFNSFAQGLLWDEDDLQSAMEDMLQQLGRTFEALATALDSSNPEDILEVWRPQLTDLLSELAHVHAQVERAIAGAQGPGRLAPLTPVLLQVAHGLGALAARVRRPEEVPELAADAALPALTKSLRSAFAPHWVLGPSDVTRLMAAVAGRGKHHARILGEELLALIDEEDGDREGRLSLYDPEDDRPHGAKSS